MAESNKDRLVDFGQIDKLDPEVSRLLAGGSQRQAARRMSKDERAAQERAAVKAEKSRTKMQARLGRRATYDLPEGTKSAVEDLAAQLKTPASQVAALLIQYGLRAIAEQRLHLKDYAVPSNSRAYDVMLRLEPQTRRGKT